MSIASINVVRRRGAEIELAEPRRSAGVTTRAGWADLLGTPSAETARSRRLAHVGGLAAVTAVIGYLTWRLAFTIPSSGPNSIAALILVGF